MSIPLVLVVFVSTVAGGSMVVAGAQFQSEQRYGISLSLDSEPNLALIIAALVPCWSPVREVWGFHSRSARSAFYRRLWSVGGCCFGSGR